MKIYSTKEMLHGLEVSHPTLTRWISEGMPCIRSNPLVFDKWAVEWIKNNKPEKYDYLVKYLKMVEK